MEFTEEELSGIIKYAQTMYPHLIDEVVDTKLANHQENFKNELDNAGFRGDDINQLLECRDMITNEEAYVNTLAVNYKLAYSNHTALYKQNKAEVIKSFATPTKGKVEADAKELELSKEMNESESIYRRVTVYSDWLHSKNNVLSQRISHLKNEYNLNQFVNNK